jgi:hypothetical protein
MVQPIFLYKIQTFVPRAVARRLLPSLRSSQPALRFHANNELSQMTSCLLDRSRRIRAIHTAGQWTFPSGNDEMRSPSLQIQDRLNLPLTTEHLTVERFLTARAAA